ncbi:hypothetical protein THRCLA_10392 [Thraustotheca clavata]|uniref:F-box domain-containing protein n=1 Tax=Thraustotheca clavata TaxID=74557 RepID=A0A1V9YR40_9STRA|nr:hypothetical protein THRCLA_10392 [Thraustotheca clavata]
MTQWHDIDALRRHVLSFLDAREVLRVSVLNRAFRTAAGYMEAIRLLDSTPLNTNFHHIATFFHATKNLSLEKCFLPLESLQFLSEFACLQRIVLQDVVFLQDQHLAMLTRTAKQLTHLTVSSCHLLSYVELIDAPALVHATFHRNLNLRQITYTCNQPSVLTELRVTCSAMFQHADALVQSIPSLTQASFTECGMLSQFILTSVHPSLESLDLDRCTVLVVVDVYSCT